MVRGIEDGLVGGTDSRRPSESASHHLERSCGHCPGRIERRGERSAVWVVRRGAERVARSRIVRVADERRRAANHSAQDPPDNRARAGKDSLHGLAGSHHDVADRRRGPPRVARGLRWRRYLRMNDNLTTLFIVMAIAGMGVMPRRVVSVRLLLLRRCWSGHGERQRRHPDRRHGQKKISKWHQTASFSLLSCCRSN
jgi:hypothetical protein